MEITWRLNGNILLFDYHNAMCSESIRGPILILFVCSESRTVKHGEVAWVRFWMWSSFYRHLRESVVGLFIIRVIHIFLPRQGSHASAKCPFMKVTTVVNKHESHLSRAWTQIGGVWTIPSSKHYSVRVPASEVECRAELGGSNAYPSWFHASCLTRIIWTDM